MFQLLYTVIKSSSGEGIANTVLCYNSSKVRVDGQQVGTLCHPTKEKKKGLW